MALSPTLPISQFEAGRMEMADGRPAVPVVRRRVSRKRAARDGECVEVGCSVEGGGADGRGGARTR
eukprot:5973788-Prorocentrum_lima.AAC.1